LGWLTACSCRAVEELEEKEMQKNKGKAFYLESHNEYLYRLLMTSQSNYWPVISRFVFLTWELA
jgi:hypothetical protein